jgi:hypothetical protein
MSRDLPLTMPETRATITASLLLAAIHRLTQSRALITAGIIIIEINPIIADIIIAVSLLCRRVSWPALITRSRADRAEPDRFACV